MSVQDKLKYLEKYSRIQDSNQGLIHNTFQNSALQSLHNQIIDPDLNFKFYTEIGGFKPYNQYKAIHDYRYRKDHYDDLIENPRINEIENEIKFQRDAQTNYIKQLNNYQKGSVNYNAARQMHLKSIEILNNLQAELKLLTTKERKQIQVKQNQDYLTYIQEEIPEISQKNKNYNPIYGFNIHFDFIYPVPSNFRKITLKYGIFREKHNFYLDENITPIVEMELNYNKKVLLEEIEFIQDLIVEPNTTIYMELDILYEKDIEMNSEPLTVWTINEIFDNHGEFCTGRFRLPFYEKNEYSNPRVLKEQGLPFFEQLSLHIRTCQPHSKHLDFKYNQKNQLRAQDYIVPPIHIKQLRDLAEMFKEYREENYDSNQDQNLQNQSMYNKTGFSQKKLNQMKQKKSVNFKIEGDKETSYYDTKSKFRVDTVDQNTVLTHVGPPEGLPQLQYLGGLYDKENEDSEGLLTRENQNVKKPAKYEFDKTRSLIDASMFQQSANSFYHEEGQEYEQNDEEIQDEEISKFVSKQDQEININQLKLKKKKMIGQYDRPWMDYKFKNKPKKRVINDIDTHDLYLEEAKQNNLQDDSQINIEEFINDNPEEIEKFNNIQYQENQQDEEKQELEIDPQEAIEVQQQLELNKEKIQNDNNLNDAQKQELKSKQKQQIKFKSLNLKQREEVNKKAREIAMKNLKQQEIKQNLQPLIQTDYRLEKLKIQQKQLQIEAEQQNQFDAEMKSLQLQQKFVKQGRQNKINDYKTKINKINNRLGGYKQQQNLLKQKQEQNKFDDSKKLILDLEEIQFPKEIDNQQQIIYNYTISLKIDNQIVSTKLTYIKYQFSGQLHVKNQNGKNLQFQHQDVFEITEKELHQIRNYWRMVLQIEIRQSVISSIQDQEIKESEEVLFFIKKPLFTPTKKYLPDRGSIQEKNPWNQILKYQLNVEIPIYEQIQYKNDHYLVIKLIQLEKYTQVSKLYANIEILSTKGTIKDENKVFQLINNDKKPISISVNNIIDFKNQEFLIEISKERLKDQYLHDYKNICIIFQFMQHSSVEVQDKEFAWFSHNLFQNQKENKQGNIENEEVVINQGIFNNQKIFDLPIQQPVILEKQISKLNPLFSYEIQYIEKSEYKKQKQEQKQINKK